MSAFISVLLLVLKILGIILLSLLGLVLLLLLLVLFVPVRYSGNGSYNSEETDFRAKATYLLHILSVSFDMAQEDKLKIKIFGIKLGKTRKKASVNTASSVNEDNNGTSNGEESLTLTEEPLREEQGLTESEDRGEEIIEGVLMDVGIDSPDENDTSLFDAFPGEEVEGTVIFDNESEDEKKTESETVKKEKRSKSDSHKTELYDKIIKYLDIIDTPSFQNSFDLCKKQLGKALKAVLPKKWKIEGRVGFEDPSLTGKACIGLSLLYPWTYKHLFISCDFEESIVEVSGYLKGRIYGITLLIVFLRMFFSRNIRRTLKMFKE